MYPTKCMKNMSWLKFLPLIISFALLLNACAPKPPDVPVCEKLVQRLATDPKTQHLMLTASPTCMKQIQEPECGHCTYIVSGKEIFVGENKKTWLNNKPWSQIQKESILVPAQESYAPLSSYLINSCEKMNCDKDVQRFKVKLDSLSSVGEVLNPSFITP